MADNIKEPVVTPTEVKKEEKVEVKPEDKVETKSEDKATADSDKKDKKDKKEKKAKKPRKPAKVVLKTWAKGLGKEAGRIAWEHKRDVLKDFITVIVCCAIMAVIFFAIDILITTFRK